MNGARSEHYAAPQFGAAQECLGFMAAVYDHVMRLSEDACLDRWRGELLRT